MRSGIALLAAVCAWAGAALAEGSGYRDLRLGRVEASAAYAAAAEAWSFELILEEELNPAEVRVDLERVTREEALGLLTTAAGHFWWVDGEGAIHVTRDTPNERRRVTAAVRRSYRLERAAPGEVRSALLTFAAHRVEVGEASVEAEVWAPRVSLADQVVAAMDGAGPSGWSVRWLVTGAGSAVSAPDPQLGAGPSRRLWFPEPTPVARLLEAVESAWDVDLVLDPAILSPGVGTLRLEAAALFEALDALTVPAGRFWAPLGGRRIMIAEEARRHHWTPLGFATMRLQRADPRDVQSVLRRLRVRGAFAGSSPPVAMVRDTPEMLAVARFVVETLEGRDPLSVPELGRLWLGPRALPRLAEAQLMVDPTTAEARRQSLAAAAPPELGPGPEPGAGVEPPSGSALRSRRLPLLHVLRDDLGLQVGYYPDCRDSTFRRMSVESPAGSGRATLLDRFTAEHSLLWTVIGPDTVLLAKEGSYSRSSARHWGVAAVPFDLGDLAAVNRVVGELELEAHARIFGPRSLLFATGRWDELGALLDAGAGEWRRRPYGVSRATEEK